MKPWNESVYNNFENVGISIKNFKCKDAQG